MKRFDPFTHKSSEPLGEAEKGSKDFASLLGTLSRSLRRILQLAFLCETKADHNKALLRDLRATAMQFTVEGSFLIRSLASSYAQHKKIPLLSRREVLFLTILTYTEIKAWHTTMKRVHCDAQRREASDVRAFSPSPSLGFSVATSSRRWMNEWKKMFFSLNRHQ